jgi:hypothetical protein
MKLKIAFTKRQQVNQLAGSKSLKDATSAFTRKSRFFILYHQRGFSLATMNTEESPFSESYYMARRIIIHYNIITAAEEDS